MNWDQVQGKWKQMRGSVREKWGQLTDDDLDVAAGNRDKFVGIIQERYGIAKEEATKRVDQWLAGMTPEEKSQQQAGKKTPEEKTYTGRP